MWKELWNATKGLLGSKTFLAAVVSGVAWCAGRFGAEIDAEELLPAVAPLWGYILTQLGAKWGKETKALGNGNGGPPA